MPAGQPEQLYAAAIAIDRIAQAHRSVASTALHDVGLSESAAGLLWLLSDTADCTMGRAAEQLSCDRSNVTLLAIQLETRGLVERAPDPIDARRRNLHLTSEGRRVAERLRAAIVDGSPLRHLTATQRADLLRLLQASLGADAMPRPERR